MTNSTDQRGAIGAQQQGNITYGVMNEQIAQKLQAATQSNPGTDFVVIQRVRQGEQPQVWSTGDPEQTKDLFRSTYTSLGMDEALERS